MNHEIVGYGVGISVVFFFLRYAVVAMPKSIAWAGVIAGLILALADTVMPTIKLTAPSIVCFVCGVLLIGASIYFGLGQSAPAQAPSSPPSSPRADPTIPPPGKPQSGITHPHVTITDSQLASPFGHGIYVGPNVDPTLDITGTTVQTGKDPLHIEGQGK